jgi:hypothetical protein
MERITKTFKGVAGTERTHEVIRPMQNVDGDMWLTAAQKDAVKGNVNIHEPIEAYYEKWDHVKDERGEYVSAAPIPNTRERRDLPPLSAQWKADAKRRFGGNNG